MATAKEAAGIKKGFEEFEARGSVAKDLSFEALHPRDRKGRDRGQFVDVPGSMELLGGKYDADRGVWLVPSDRRAEFDRWLDDIGYDSLFVRSSSRRGRIPSGTESES